MATRPTKGTKVKCAFWQCQEMFIPRNKDHICHHHLCRIEQEKIIKARRERNNGVIEASEGVDFE